MSIAGRVGVVRERKRKMWMVRATMLSSVRRSGRCRMRTQFAKAAFLMPFALCRFTRTRPFQYHLTAAANVPRIRRMGRLESAARTFVAGGCPELMRRRRTEICRILVGGEEVYVRDQEPLCRRNMKLDPACWTFDDFVEKLNGLVFFWPGGRDGPIQPGRKHFKRYQEEKPALIRVCTQPLFDTNSCTTPLFCRYNSGAPRCSKGKSSPRGEQTFLDAGSFPDTPGKVIETTFPESVVLPEDATEIGRAPEGPWKPFFQK